MSVLRSLTIITLPLLISGCASFSLFGGEKVKPLEVQTKAVERTRLNIPEQKPLTLDNEVKWIVVTPENIENVWAQLKEQNVDLVLFAITDDGYENLALTLAEIRNYLATQRSILIKYKEYYEPSNGTDGNAKQTK